MYTGQAGQGGSNYLSNLMGRRTKRTSAGTANLPSWLTGLGGGQAAWNPFSTANQAGAGGGNQAVLDAIRSGNAGAVRSAISAAGGAGTAGQQKPGKGAGLPYFPDPGRPDIPIGPYPGRPDIPIGPMPPAPPPGGGAWDFWTSVASIFGDDPEVQTALRDFALSPGTKWKMPKYAQEALRWANMLKTMDMEDDAKEVVLEVIGQGFRRPSYNLSGIFQPLASQWGWGASR